MLVEGRALAANIMQKLAARVVALGRAPQLTIFVCEPTFEAEKFIALKQKRAQEIGVSIEVVRLDAEVSTPSAIMAVQQAVAKSDGIVVQLPFPSRIDIEEVLIAIPPPYDVDMLTYDGSQSDILPPVVGAVAAITQAYEVDLAGKEVVVLGQGKLVGSPVTTWLRTQGIKPTVITEGTADGQTKLRQADVIFTGIGKPNFITPDMIKSGAIIFDAGTSESSGVLAGDVDQACAEKAALMTPVPGGIGPLTVVMLLQNVISMAEQR